MMRSRSGAAVNSLASGRRFGESSPRRGALSKNLMPNPLAFQGVNEISRLDAEVGVELDRLRERGLHRRLRRVEGLQAPRMRVDGRDCLMLAGSNYLDLAGDARVIETYLGARKDG